MFKFVVVLFAVIACAAAKPGLISAPLAYTAPAAVLTAPAPVVTATSSQFIARNHNGIASASVVAPIAAAPAVAKFVQAGPAPLAAPVVATPLAYSSPLAYSAPVVGKYAATYSHPLTYSAPLTYAAGAAVLL